MPHSSVHASHILVKDGAMCERLYRDIQEGKATFEDVAKKHSICPSAAKAGDLGVFKEGMMIREFNDLAFDEQIPLHTAQACLETPFGHHIVKLHSRD